MPRKGKLLAALDAHKGRDFEAEKRKKQVKNAEKRKRKRNEEDGDEEDEDLETGAPVNGDVTSKAVGGVVTETFEQFASDDEEDEEDEDEEDSDQDGQPNGKIIPQPDITGDASASEAEQESDLALSDLSEDDREDVVPHQRMTINNLPALIASRKRVSVVSDKPKHPFHYHNSLVSSDSPADTLIPDAMDDETRELMFYKIARDASVTARTLLKKEKIPFTRPTDYFAEMVKTDDHMEKVKKKLYDEAASKKAAQEARRLRDAKKFGKQVQVAKEQERAKEKKETLNKIQELKRKRKDTDTGRVTEGDDLFQEINVDSSSKNKSDGLSRKDRANGDRGDASKRQKRDSKFGFGGKKKYSKSGTAESSGDLSGFSASRMKGGTMGGRGGRGGSAGGRGGRGGRGGSRGGAAQRPGKSRRMGASRS